MSCSSTILGDILIPPFPMFRIVPAVPGRERRPSPFWDPGPALCLSYHKLPEDATGCAGPMSRRRLWARNSSQQKARAQEGPVPQRDVRGLAAAACRPPGLGENGPLAARAPGFSRWESALFGCAGARRAGGCGPGNDKMAANEKRGRRRALSRSGMCAAWARQLAAQTAASKGRGFFFHGRKFGRGVESLFHF